MYRFLPTARSATQAALMTVLLACLPPPASAALLATMEATGEVQGAIEGGSTISGREGLIEVIEYGHSFSQAVDNATGKPAGKTQHRTVRLIKAVDKATPKLTQALVDKEKLTSVVFRFYRPTPGGFEEQFYTVELFNAYVVNVSQSSRTYGDDDWTAAVPVPPNETLTISYEKIIWTFENGGISAEDNWAQGQP